MPNVPQHVDHELAGRRSIESIRSDKEGVSFQTARRAQGLNLETAVLVQIDDVELAKVAANANSVSIARLTKAPRLAQIIELGRTAKACAEARSVLIEEMKMERLGLLTPEGIGNVQPVRDWAREIIEVRRSQ